MGARVTRAKHGACLVLPGCRKHRVADAADKTCLSKPGSRRRHGISWSAKRQPYVPRSRSATICLASRAVRTAATSASTPAQTRHRAKARLWRRRSHPGRPGSSHARKTGDTFVIGAGNTTADGGPGRDLISTVAGGQGTVTVRSFNGGEKISLQGYAAGEANRALSAVAASGTPANLVLSDGTKVNFVGATQLDARSFV